MMPSRGIAPWSPAQVAGSGDTVEVSSGTAIQNAAVVNTRDGTVAQGMTLVVDAGRIQKIGPTASIRLGGAVQAVDASGKYVVPGFLDMHTHALGSLDEPPGDLPLLLANGVTGIREMSGSPAFIRRARQLNADSAAGHVDAPEVLLVPSNVFIGQQAGTADGAMQFVNEKLAEGPAHRRYV
jgi:hypothetical protein